MKLKPVFRYDPRFKILRLFRLLWQRGTVGDGKGYSAKLSFAFKPGVFSWHSEYFGWRLMILGIRVHYLRAYGGTIV